MKKALLDLLICPGCLPEENRLQETISEAFKEEITVLYQVDYPVLLEAGVITKELMWENYCCFCHIPAGALNS